MADKAIIKSQETLEYLSHNPAERAKYEARRKYMLDYNTGMLTSREEGIAEGIEKGKLEEKRVIAKNMLLQGLSLDLISKIIDLSEQEIKNL